MWIPSILYRRCNFALKSITYSLRDYPWASHQYEIGAANWVLWKMGLRGDAGCPKCLEEMADIKHMYWFCSSLDRLWRDAIDLIFGVYAIQVPMDPRVGVLGYVGDIIGDRIDMGTFTTELEVPLGASVTESVKFCAILSSRVTDTMTETRHYIQWGPSGALCVHH